MQIYHMAIVPPLSVLVHGSMVAKFVSSYDKVSVGLLMFVCSLSLSISSLEGRDFSTDIAYIDIIVLKAYKSIQFIILEHFSDEEIV